MKINITENLNYLFRCYIRHKKREWGRVQFHFNTFKSGEEFLVICYDGWTSENKLIHKKAEITYSDDNHIEIWIRDAK